MQELAWIIGTITPVALVDITIVALVFFAITFSFRGRQAASLLRGIAIAFVGLFLVANFFRLVALSWLLNYAFIALIVALPLIFQNELRGMLERLGRGRLFVREFGTEDLRTVIVNEIVKACEKLSVRRHGALIVLQKGTGLDEFISTGVPLDAIVRAELLLTIFWPKTELHDGAVIINRDGVIASSAAVLPLTASRNLPVPKMGTRHRAAIGISEVSDALCVVVSEESGKISIAHYGRLITNLEPERLRSLLNANYSSTFAARQTGLRASLRSVWQTWQSLGKQT